MPRILDVFVLSLITRFLSHNVSTMIIVVPRISIRHSQSANPCKKTNTRKMRQPLQKSFEINKILGVKVPAILADAIVLWKQSRHPLTVVDLPGGLSV